MMVDIYLKIPVTGKKKNIYIMTDNSFEVHVASCLICTLPSSIKGSDVGLKTTKNGYTYREGNSVKMFCLSFQKGYTLPGKNLRRPHFIVASCSTKQTRSHW